MKLFEFLDSFYVKKNRDQLSKAIIDNTIKIAIGGCFLLSIVDWFLIQSWQLELEILALGCILFLLWLVYTKSKVSGKKHIICTLFLVLFNIVWFAFHGLDGPATIAALMVPLIPLTLFSGPTLIFWLFIYFANFTSLFALDLFLPHLTSNYHNEYVKDAHTAFSILIGGLLLLTSISYSIRHHKTRNQRLQKSLRKSRKVHVKLEEKIQELEEQIKELKKSA